VSKILVVDDELSVRNMVKDIIESDCHEVVVALNGLEALNMCANTTFDLIITDIVMPEKNGIDLIMEVRQKYPDIPVIAISGGGDITGRYDYLEIANLVGAKNIIKKPFTVNDIRSAVDSVLGVNDHV